MYDYAAYVGLDIHKNTILGGDRGSWASRDDIAYIYSTFPIVERQERAT